MMGTPRRRGLVLAEVVAGISLCLAAAAAEQTPPRPKPDSRIGEVSAIDPEGYQMTVTLDAGGVLKVVASEQTPVLRAAPGATSLADAKPTAFSTIAKGDRVLVRGSVAEDALSMKAKQVVVMVREDIAQKREAEKADWAKRGILGTVTATDVARGEITVQLRRFGGTSTLTLPVAGRKVAFKRYAPDSVKFADAKPSDLAAVQVGDQLRALGDRSADGSTFTAEQIVFGTFRTVIGQTETVDAAKGEIVLRDDDGKRLTVSVGPDARLRQLPPEFAARLAPRPEGSPDRARSGGASDATHQEGGQPPSAGPGGDGARPFRGGGGAGRGSDDILERFPVTSLADLKAGGRVLVASTKGTDPSRLNAIAIVTGLEALRPAIQGGRGARGGGGDFGIPADLTELGMGGMGGP